MTTTIATPLKQLSANHGQSPWFDYIRRNMLTSGQLARMIEDDGLRGVTSNPAIFEKAIAGSTDYDEELKALQGKSDMKAKMLYERLAVKDIQDAADTLRKVYDATGKHDGYVSLEVSPYLARDTKGTIAEARRLWKDVGRANVMIKVPATKEGLPAIETLIGEGINVNVTLLFAREAYEQVAQAYLAGLEKAAAKGIDLSHIASVASFFVSRIDAAIDAQVTARLKTATKPDEIETLKRIQGKVAIANARVAYQSYKRIFASPRFEPLKAKGAQNQRMLWASTGTKDPRYSDVLYVEELIGRDTVNTIPPATWDAFRDHGKPRDSLEEGVEAAQGVLDGLAKVDISLAAVCKKLLDDGVQLFADAFDKLLGAVEKKRKGLLGAKINRTSVKLPEDLDKAVKAALEDWRAGGKIRRLYERDATLWTGKDEAHWMGWLGIAEEERLEEHCPQFKAIADDVRKAGFKHVLLLGMGGSSLCPEVMARTFGEQKGFPKLHVLDSTDPAQIRAVEKKIDIESTLFIVASKSGSTLEPNIFKQYFFERAKEALGGAAEAGKRFVAITDPGSKLLQVAEQDGFRQIFYGVPSIGGRFSALSNFGMVPAACMGVDVEKFIDEADEMVNSCAPSVPPEDNPGVVLGTVLGVLAKQGRDKLTVIASPGVRAIGAWLEQLIAESTGKEGKGVIPVDLEEVGPPATYGQDRLFVYVKLETAPDEKQDAAVDALEKAGHPVVRIAMADAYQLGEEFFRWEIATAVAGSILGINPFDQPDVEASKIETKKLMNEVEKTGSLPAERPALEERGVKLFTNDANAAALSKAAAKNQSLEGWLRAHLDRLGAGDYLCLLAYVEMNPAHEAELQRIRHAVRDRKKVATCLGFGPRFLHSTGQAYKGGPNTGVFLQVTCDDAADLKVPGQTYTFGAVKAAQARGDFGVLASRGRRCLRVHLGSDVRAGLEKIGSVIEKALA